MDKATLSPLVRWLWLGFESSFVFDCYCDIYNNYCQSKQLRPGTVVSPAKDN